MAVRIVRLGASRLSDEGLRLGTVRRLPRGVRKTDYAKRDYFDLWLPELAPSARLLAAGHPQQLTDQRWVQYRKSYRREMQAPTPQRLLHLLAQLSHQANFSVGCYCEREERCHRSLLLELLVEHGANARDG